jgi:radical SAM superfamily enzyme YgiQ (UPF0313 family)
VRVAIVLPPLRDLYLSPRRLSALGCRILETLLQNKGHETKPFIFPLSGKGRPLPPGPDETHLENWLLPGESGPLSFFSSMKHFGPSWEAAAETLAAWNPQAVFISSFAYAYAEDAVLLAASLRHRLPQTLLIAGGGGPSAWPPYYLDPPPELLEQHKDSAGPRTEKRPIFDAVFTGEAEAGFPLLHDFLMHAKPAREKSILLSAPQPPPRENMTAVFSVQRETPTEIWASSSLSRGCPLGCAFCSSRLSHGKELRTIPLSAIEKAAGALPKGKRIHLNFEDDNLLLDTDWFFEVLGFFRKRFPGAAFAAENGLDYRLLTPQLAEKLITLGFEKFNFSLATLSPQAAEEQNRNPDTEAFLAAAKIVEKARLPLVNYFIAGLPHDSPKSIVDHLSFLSRSPGLAGISLFYPVPGVSGFDPPPGLLRKKPGLARASLAWPWTGSLTTGSLVTAFRLARLVNLLKKLTPAPEEKNLLAAVLSQKKLSTLTHKNTLTRPPCDKELEKLFFDTL